jgi:hypothetical protein
MIGTNDVHCILENKISCKECFLKKIELEKLTNGELGTKFSVFMKFNRSFQRFAMTIGEMSPQ